MLAVAAVQAASLLGKASGALFANKKDPSRIATAQSNLTKALAGDASALQALKDQAAGSATQVGKDAARAALAAYAAQAPTFAAPGGATPLQQQVGATVDNIRRDLSNGLQNVGAGATTALSNAVAPVGSKNALTLPLTKNQILILAAVAAGVILLRKHF